MIDDIVVAALPNGRSYGVQLVTVDTEPAVSTAEGSDRLTSPTGLKDRVIAGVGDLAELLGHVAAEIGREVGKIDADVRPSAVEAEVTVALSGQVGPVLVVSGSAEWTVRAKLTWQVDGSAPSA